MSIWAVIKNGMVVNTVVWDGTGDIFDEFDTYEIKDGEVIGIGYSASQDSNGKWTFAAPVIVVTPEEQAAINLQKAQSEYDRASAKITALQQQIDDENYSGTDTEASVAATKSIWTTYRKALRAYSAAANGSLTFPIAPDAR